MSLDDYFATIELADPLDNLTSELLDELRTMLDRIHPSRLDRTHSSIAPAAEGISIEMRHRDDPGLAVGLEAFGVEVVVNYGEEHEHFNVEHEFIDFAVGPLATEFMVPRIVAFLEALMTGRIELHVTHRFLYVSTVSYWINDAGERERFLSGGTVIPTFKWTKEPIVKNFDFR
ncbi:MAG: hypothetical protein HKO10_08335 [Acidimicrobiia bacterium]|nr:hypothetical protein [Acidimicrobiia bacterium]